MPIYTLHSPLTAVEVEARLDLVPLKVTGNTIISAGTNTKVSYDSKGLVTGGSSATTADITSSLDKRYVTDADVTKIAAITASFTSAQETKLAGIAAGATVGAAWATNLSGIPAVVSGTTASFTSAQETKLAGIASGATVGAAWATNLSGIPAVVSGATASYTTEEAAKLAGIASGATVGAAWATNLSGIPAVVSGATASYTTEEAAKLAGIPVGGGGGGKVLQVVYANTHAGLDMSYTGTYSTTGLTLSITPIYANSKILIIAGQNGIVYTLSGGSTNANLGFQIFRNAQVVYTSSAGQDGSGCYTFGYYQAPPSLMFRNVIPLQYLDSPATTLATTYTIYGLLGAAGSYCSFNYGGSTITLMEIAG